MNYELAAYIKKFDPNTTWVKLISNSTELSLLCDFNWVLDNKKITSHLNTGTLIIDCSTDPFNRHEEAVVKDLLLITTDFIVLSGDINYLKNPHPHICFFPYWYLNQQEYPPLPIDITLNDNRTYKISCLNGRSRYHRIENYIKLKSKSYFKELLFKMHNNFDIVQEKKEFEDKYTWNEEYITEFLKVKDSFDEYPNDHSVDDQAYTNSYINYVTETSISSDILFFSEKTWKPLMSGQFGLWLGNPGTVNFLRTVGFDMFDDIIDHTYDREENFHLRLNLLHQSIDQLINKDLKQLFIETNQRRLNNQKLFYSHELQNFLTNQCHHYQNKINIK